MNTVHNRRILLINDTPAIHENFREVFSFPSAPIARSGRVSAFINDLAIPRRSGVRLKVEA